MPLRAGLHMRERISRKARSTGLRLFVHGMVPVLTSERERFWSRQRENRFTHTRFGSVNGRSRWRSSEQKSEITKASVRSDGKRGTAGAALVPQFIRSSFWDGTEPRRMTAAAS